MLLHSGSTHDIIFLVSGWASSLQSTASQDVNIRGGNNAKAASEASIQEHTRRLRTPR